MSHIEIVPPPVINVTPIPPAEITVTTVEPQVVVVAAGNVGPRGPQGQWEALTQAEYDALSPPNPDTLYVIIA